MLDASFPLDLERLQLSPHDVERRKAFVGLQAEDVARIRSIQDIFLPNADRYVAAFFDHLAGIAETARLSGSHSVLEEAKRLEHEHLVAMMQGDYGRDYMEQRVRLGMLYSRADLDVNVLLGGFHVLMRLLGMEIMRHFAEDPAKGFDVFMSLKKIGFIDIGLIVDVLIAERERVISVQQEAIRELSTPVLQVRDRLLILPIIGIIDSMRAKQLTDELLQAIRANRARIVVMDVTGVAAVDSKVANHFIQTVAAASLMGADVIITGLSADVAQALVGLGVDLSSIRTMNDLQGGLEEAERQLGYKIVRLDNGAPAIEPA